MKRVTMFRSLAVRNYRLYAAGQLLSNPGTWMQRIAQDWLVLQLSGGSGIALGLTTALQFLPMLLFGLVGGALVDRLDKRRLLIGTQSAMAVLAVGLGVLATAGAAEVWHVYLFAFGLGMVTVVDNPGRQSFVPEMVGRDHLTNAIALNSASFQLGRVTGPAIAGLLIAWVGSGPVFLINGASFGFTILALALIRTSELNRTDRAVGGKGRIREGLAYIASRRDLVVLLVLAACTQFFGANVQNQLALMVNNVFETGADAFGWAAACLAVGSLAGALLAARRERPHLRLVLLGAMVFGMLQALAGFMPSYLAFVVVLVPMGVAFMTFVTTLNATFQLSVDPQMRGRVMSMFLLVFMGVAPLGAPVVGFLADAFGPGTSMFIGGSVTVVVVAVLTLALRWAKGITLRELFVDARIDEGRPQEGPEAEPESAEEGPGDGRAEETAEPARVEGVSGSGPAQTLDRDGQRDGGPVPEGERDGGPVPEGEQAAEDGPDGRREPSDAGPSAAGDRKPPEDARRR